MKITPIAFNTEMVKAILKNSKTKTRREMDPQPWYGSRVPGGPHFKWPPGSGQQFNAELSTDGTYYVMQPRFQAEFSKQCPYGKPGDVLYVQEPFKVGAWDDEENKAAFDYQASPEIVKTPWCQFEHYDEFDELHHQLLDELDELGIEPEIREDEERIYYNWLPGQSPFKWKDPQLMPKEAARIFLKIKSVKIERLYEISQIDAVAEGIHVTWIAPGMENCKYKNYINDGRGSFSNPIQSFWSLWRDIKGDESWNANPWLWVIEFEQIDKPENF